MTDIMIIVAVVVSMLLIIALVGFIIFIFMAKKKRATRGTYCPSRQEMAGCRMQMDNIMKPPPEERLI